MAKVEIAFRVKYGDAFYAPHVSIEVEDKDIEELVSLGAKVLSQTPQVSEPQSKPTDKKSEKKVPYKIPTPAKKG
jgi:hypothetical protein